MLLTLSSRVEIYNNNTVFGKATFGAELPAGQNGESNLCSRRWHSGIPCVWFADWSLLQTIETRAYIIIAAKYLRVFHENI
jgi:hypothetical protein